MLTLGNGTIARCAAVWLGALALAVGTVGLLAPDLQPSGRLDFEAVVLATAAWALVAAACWALAVTTVVAVQVARTAPVPHRGLPAPVRRVLLRACGAVVAGGLVAVAVTGPAAATPGSLGRDAAERPAQTVQPRTVQPPAGPQPASGPAVVRTATAESRVTVRPGDSLWRIAETALRAHDPGSAPSAAAVAAYWPRIHDANRVLVGPDPHLVRPGVPLVLPAPDPQET